MSSPNFEIFLVSAPGLEQALCDEVKAKRFPNPKVVTGGVTFDGTWSHVMRANLEVRGTGRVLARLGSFHVSHLAQLDKLARKFPWYKTLRKDVPVRVEASCRKSKIYHAGAAQERIERAIKEELGAVVDDEALVGIKVRIENDLCTVSLDTSGEMLHKRGHKEAMAKAPIRETMASLLLAQCGFKGDEPIYDPMCGSGTFVIEAAEIALGLKSGRARQFAFEQTKIFDAKAWEELKSSPDSSSPLMFHGSDRDQGAIKAATANAKRAGVVANTSFIMKAIGDIAPPEGAPGLVMINPPYGTRIGDKKPLLALYQTLGKVLQERFKGWRVGLVTTDQALARSTGLKFGKTLGPINHGGLKIYLYRTPPIG